MKFGVASQSAVEALFSNPLRSLLTMLGIIIGVASVMIMMSIGEGARAQIEAQISSVGTNMLTMQPGNMNRGGRNQGGGSGRPFSEADVAAIADMPFVQAATGVLNGNVTAVSEDANWVTRIEGGSADYFEVNNWHTVEGREFSTGQMLVFASGADAVVSASSQATLMILGGEPLGERYIEWNFVSSSKERIEQAKADWRAGRMKLPDLDHEEFIPLPPDPLPPASPVS
jgi:hypothetical protein